MQGSFIYYLYNVLGTFLIVPNARINRSVSDLKGSVLYYVENCLYLYLLNTFKYGF